MSYSKEIFPQSLTMLTTFGNFWHIVSLQWSIAANDKNTKYLIVPTYQNSFEASDSPGPSTPTVMSLIKGVIAMKRKTCALQGPKTSFPKLIWPLYANQSDGLVGLISPNKVLLALASYWQVSESLQKHQAIS